MRYLLLIFLGAIGCNHTKEIDLATTKWQLYSMSAHSNKRLNSMNQSSAFAEDTSNNKVYVHFKNGSSMDLLINSNTPFYKFGFKYKIYQDTIFLEDPSKGDTGTFLIKKYSKDFLDVSDIINGIDYKLKRFE